MELGTEHVVVTGAGGWLGRSLVRALLHGLSDHPALAAPDPAVRLRCLLHPAEAEAQRAELEGLSDRVEVVVGDLTDPGDCRALFAETHGALLFHLAGVIHPRRVRDFYRVNVQGTETLLDAAQSAEIRRAVIVSSNSPFGTNPHADHLFDEHSPFRPYMHYGRSKMRMEQAVMRRQEQSHLDAVRIRAPWFYGPWQPPRQTVFFTMIRQGKGPIVGGGENRRSMAYVDNLSQGLLLAAITPAAAGRAYWIADRRPYTMNEIIDTVERLLEDEFGLSVARKRLRLPGLASQVAYACDWMLQGLGIYHQKIHVLSEMNKSIACSVALAERELDYRPAVALEEGMRRSIRWCLDAGYEI